MSHAGPQSQHAYDYSDDVHVGAALLSAAGITGDEVRNMQAEKLGNIQDVMLDIAEGRIRYALLASGGFAGTADRLFAVPWGALKQDTKTQGFTLDLDVERLKNAPVFDRDQWPDTADVTWNLIVESYYAR